MNNSPKVSVIIPILNSREYINECLDSVINQTLKDIEILCIDAGSTDGTREILQEYARKDSRIKIIDSPKKSYGYQVNLGFDSAQGEYIAIVESDDYILSDMYDVLYIIAKKYELDGVKSDSCEFYGDKNNRKFKKIHLMHNKKYYNSILNPHENKILFNAYMINPPGIYKLSFIRNNHIRLNESPGASYQDHGLWFQIFMYCEKMYFYPKALYMVRRDNPNSSVKSKDKIYCGCDEFDYIYNLICTDINRKNEYAPFVALYRYYSNEITLQRIENKNKLDFLIRYSNDFTRINNNGELKYELFTQYELDKILSIIDNPIRYYARNFRNIAFNENKYNNSEYESREKLISKIRILTYIVEGAQQDIDDKTHELECVYKSKSFKVGRMTTWFPRKLIKTFQYYQKKGFSCTISKIVHKFKSLWII